MSEPEVLNLADLAGRWKVSEDEARRIVSASLVPFFRVSPSRERINWKLIRFKVEQVREWEDASKEVFRSGGKSDTNPKTPLPSHPKKSRMKNWRKSSPAT